jgi:RimJ/RimL family protein N-acetyltransferase
MEKMPHFVEPHLLTVSTSASSASTYTAPARQALATDWRDGLPVLAAGDVVLRELRAADAPALFALLTADEVARFISPPPLEVQGFERFIAFTEQQRATGAYVCFAITMKGFDTAIGLIQVRQLEPGFGAAEWGFAIGSAFWGMGVFRQAAELVLEFAFDTLRVHRLEARACLANGRGIGALRKLGACHEAVLRRAFLRNGEYLDQGLYTIIGDEWRASRMASRLDTYRRIH